jgi:hypothetical protein
MLTKETSHKKITHKPIQSIHTQFCHVDEGNITKINQINHKQFISIILRASEWQNNVIYCHDYEENITQETNPKHSQNTHTQSCHVDEGNTTQETNTQSCHVDERNITQENNPQTHTKHFFTFFKS